MSVEAQVGTCFEMAPFKSRDSSRNSSRGNFRAAYLYIQYYLPNEGTYEYKVDPRQ